jgi:hypothetical protein
VTSSALCDPGHPCDKVTLKCDPLARISFVSGLVWNPLTVPHWVFFSHMTGNWYSACGKLEGMKNAELQVTKYRGVSAIEGICSACQRSPFK